MKTVVIIHFQPLELYPPIQNLLRSLEGNSLPERIVVITTSTHLKLNAFQLNTIKIVRAGKSNHRSGGFFRYWNYARFYITCIFRLIGLRPAAVLYYETLSSFPAFLYKKIINRSADVLIHYHEYTAPKAYANGMFLERLFHTLEMKLYPIARWVSHTNDYRMGKFKEDLLPVVVAHPVIMPNYPPKNWYRKPATKIEKPVRVVYAGALSLQTMYLKEFADWVIQQNGNVLWDIYSYNSSEEIIDYIKTINSPWVELKEGVDYDKLPAILKHYNIGVVLYKGHIPNYVYNAPNKLFEYYACGLDVWIPDVMIGSIPYVTKGVYPKIISINFNALNFFILDDALSRNALENEHQGFYCEVAYAGITKIITSYA